MTVADFYAHGVSGPQKLDLAIRYAKQALSQEEEKALAKIAEYEEMMKQIKELVDYCNNQFSKISVTYNQMVPKISNQFYERNTKYKILKAPSDGSGGGSDAIVEIIQ